MDNEVVKAHIYLITHKNQVRLKSNLLWTGVFVSVFNDRCQNRTLALIVFCFVLVITHGTRIKTHTYVPSSVTVYRFTRWHLCRFDRRGQTYTSAFGPVSSGRAGVQPNINRNDFKTKTQMRRHSF